MTFCIDYYLTVLFRGKIVRLNLKLLNLKQLLIFSRLLNYNTHLNVNSSSKCMLRLHLNKMTCSKIAENYIQIWIYRFIVFFTFSFYKLTKISRILKSLIQVNHFQKHRFTAETHFFGQSGLRTGGSLWVISDIHKVRTNPEVRIAGIGG